MFIAFGSLFPNCVAAAEQLQADGLDVGVVNARFTKPLDHETILRAVSDCPFVITVEESTLAGGCGSAVLEAANDAGLNTANITRLGIPDQFVEHGERGELLTSLGLDTDGLATKARELAKTSGVTSPQQVSKSAG